MVAQTAAGQTGVLGAAGDLVDCCWSYLPAVAAVVSDLRYALVASSGDFGYEQSFFKGRKKAGNAGW
jgi:hypothetical protein